MDISLKRIIAYILDILLVTLVATLISQVKFINPNLDKYMETYDEYRELIKETESPDTEKIMQMNYTSHMNSRIYRCQGKREALKKIHRR